MMARLSITPSDDELAFIAALDYAQDVERHLVALRSLVRDQDGLLAEGQHWFPYEVIELGSHSLQPGHEREFVICTLLVLANVAAGLDTSTDVEAKFSDRAADYDRLPTPLKEEVLSAFQAIEG